MAETENSRLRIWHGDVQPNAPGRTQTPLVATLRSAFEHATGWVLERVEPSNQTARRLEAGQVDLDAAAPLEIVDMSPTLEAGQRAVHRVKCDALARAISGILIELARSRQQLRSTQLELATNSIAAFRSEQLARWGESLTKLLVAATAHCGFESGAIYLLDGSAQSLWRRFASGPALDLCGGQQRALVDAPADVEAMLGHAIVLTRIADIKKWRVPAVARAAVCLPVSSLSNVLGTAWFVTGRRRRISSSLLNQMELIVGRIAAEIETQSLLRQLNEAQRARTSG